MFEVSAAAKPIPCTPLDVQIACRVSAQLGLLVAFACMLTACEPELGPNGIPVAADGALACGQPAAPIHALQGNQAMSPVVGDVVEVEARVSAKFLDGLGGFYLVSEPGSEDQDAASSEGLFVRYAEPD